MLPEELLKDCWRDLRTDAAYGVDEGSAQADEQDGDETLSDLVERLKRTSYRAKRGRRPSLPTGDGQLRAVGIPAVEDKRRQWAVTRLLTAIDAQDCLRCRYGYRPPLGALEAGDNRTITLPCGRYHWVGAAEIKGVFDTIEPEWMIRRVAERSDDRALLRLSKKGRNAGGRDTDGKVLPPVRGPPQGGIVSPLLANGDLH